MKLFSIFALKRRIDSATRIFSPVCGDTYDTRVGTGIDAFHEEDNDTGG